MSTMSKVLDVTSCFAFMFCVGILVNSCTWIEPSPVENGVKPPQDDLSATIQYNWSADDTLAGNLNLNLLINKSSFKIEKIDLIIDSIAVPSNSGGTFPFHFNARRLPNGKQTITFDVLYQNTTEYGLYNFITVPSDSLSTTINFAHLPMPLDPFVYHFSPNGRFHPKLTWEYPSVLEKDVKYYVVNRIVYGTNKVLHSDTLYTRMHEYVDSTFTTSADSVFACCSFTNYSIGVANELGIVYTFNYSLSFN